MEIYRVKVTVSEDGSVTIKELPFHPGERVGVIVCSQEKVLQNQEQGPLRGKPIHCTDPSRSVAEEDWDVLQ